MAVTPLRALAPAPAAEQAPRPAPRPPADLAPSCCSPARDGDEAACPSCGAEMRLWANYYRCRTCGFKESCCF
jgi:hypothetical protein